MLAVGINGYGTIGKRVADAARAQPDMNVAGVVKTTPDHVVSTAQKRGFPVYVPDRAHLEDFRDAGDDPAGTLSDLLASCDVIVDATPGGIGKTHVPAYREAEVPYILQGAEPAEVAGASFCARANGPTCVGRDSLRVVSCNTTGLSRALAPLRSLGTFEHVDATLIRRGGDPTQSDRGPINDIVPTMEIPTHHAADLQTVLPDIPIETVAMTVPTTLMHVHRVTVTFESEPTDEAVRQCLTANDRLALVPRDRGIDSIGQLIEVGRDTGRPRGDVWENCIWDASITIDGRRLSFVQAIHQESIVVPESVDAIRTLAGGDPLESADRTDDHLGIGDLFAEQHERPAPIPAE